jgi:tetratricopeptide (TPR) repeat protein
MLSQEGYSARDYAAMGDGYAKAGNYREAVTAYLTAIRLNPENRQTYADLADTYRKLKDFPQALAAYAAAVRLKPTASAYNILGKAYADLGYHQEAVAAFQKALELEPPKSIETTVQAVPLQATVSAAAHTTSKPTSTVSANLAPLMDLDGQVHHLIEEARVAVSRGRYLDALQAGQQALKLDPENAMALIHMATAYSQTGQFMEAEECYRLILRSRPNDENVLYQMADACVRSCRYPQAIRAYELAISLKPRHSQARFRLGLLQARLKKRQLAMVQYDVLKVIDVDLAGRLMMEIQKIA